MGFEAKIKQQQWDFQTFHTDSCLFYVLMYEYKMWAGQCPHHVDACRQSRTHSLLMQSALLGICIFYFLLYFNLSLQQPFSLSFSKCTCNILCVCMYVFRRLYICQGGQGEINWKREIPLLLRRAPLASLTFHLIWFITLLWCYCSLMQRIGPFALKYCDILLPTHRGGMPNCEGFSQPKQEMAVTIVFNHHLC